MTKRKTKTKKPKKRNKQDATLININALKKRVDVLEIGKTKFSLSLMRIADQWEVSYHSIVARGNTLIEAISNFDQEWAVHLTKLEDAAAWEDGK